jgi:hypothetical protein
MTQVTVMTTAFYDRMPYGLQFFERAGGGNCVLWRFHDFRLTTEKASPSIPTQ